MNGFNAQGELHMLYTLDIVVSLRRITSINAGELTHSINCDIP